MVIGFDIYLFRATVVAADAFLDAFQRIADLANSSRGQFTSLTLYSHFAAYTSTFICFRTLVIQKELCQGIQEAFQQDIFSEFFSEMKKLHKSKAHVVVNHVTLRFGFIGSQSELKIFLVVVYFGKVYFL